MPIDSQTLLNWRFEDLVRTYDERDTMLYALGLGVGADPLDPRQLRFVYERDLVAFPTMPVVLGYPTGWAADPRTGIDYVRMVHGEQGLVLHRPLPPAGTIRSRQRIVRVIDKGPDRGAVVHLQRSISDARSEERLATALTVLFCRADGGFGGDPGLAPPPHPIPSRQADAAVEIATLPQQALLYRLNGDRNPLHADPEVAGKAGFPRPILHGLCTYGIAARAVLSAFGNDEPGTLKELQVRFAGPVLPGEAISVELWHDGPEISFRAWVPARDARVLDHGRALLSQ